MGFIFLVVISATTMPQLKENIGSAEITLSQEILDEINAVHDRMPNPAP